LDPFSPVLVPKSGQFSGFDDLDTLLSGYTPRRDL
jgi:hypothetical protein